MYGMLCDKIQKYWKLYLVVLQAELETYDEMDRPNLENTIRFMRRADMAVGVSQGQNEIDDMRKKAWISRVIATACLHNQFSFESFLAHNPFEQRILQRCEPFEAKGRDITCVHVNSLDFSLNAG